MALTTIAIRSADEQQNDERRTANASNSSKPYAAPMQRMSNQVIYRSPGRTVPLDRNAKARIAAYARAWSARNRQPRQHKGPITRAFLDVLQALLWGFHNSRDGRCFPSYEAIAARAGCARSTVAEALNILEWAGVLTWQHRITRVRERCSVRQHQLGVARASSQQLFWDPQQQASSHQSENRTRTKNQSLIGSVRAPARNADSALERALARFGAAVAAKYGLEQGAGS
jgi:DNA-binding transcriptional regulator YhcF (GntR family)